MFATDFFSNSGFQDYLLYGRFYLPTGRLDALYSTRLSPTLQAVVAAISEPPSTVHSDTRGKHGDASNVMLSLQHDVGKWCTEYTWSAEDSMWGVKFLHNFGRLGLPPVDIVDESRSLPGIKRVDEEEPVEGGLKGRLSAGAEFYFSAKERSAGGKIHVIQYIFACFTGALYSVDWHPFHHYSRRDAAFLSSAGLIFLLASSGTAFSTPDDDNCFIQSHAGSLVRSVFRQSLTRSFIVVAFRF